MALANGAPRAHALVMSNANATNAAHARTTVSDGGICIVMLGTKANGRQLRALQWRIAATLVDTLPDGATVDLDDRRGCYVVDVGTNEDADISTTTLIDTCLAAVQLHTGVSQ